MILHQFPSDSSALLAKHGWLPWKPTRADGYPFAYQGRTLFAREVRKGEVWQDPLNELEELKTLIGGETCEQR